MTPSGEGDLVTSQGKQGLLLGDKRPKGGWPNAMTKETYTRNPRRRPYERPKERGVLIWEPHKKGPVKKPHEKGE